MRKIKQGISLIVLVITIIVMIILAAAVIISLDNAGIIGAAENAVCKTNIKQAQNLAVLVWSNIYTNPDEYTMDNVEDKLRGEFEKNGLKYEDYNVEVTKNGIEVSSKAGCTDSSGVEGGNDSGDAGSDVVPTNWDYAYTYDRAADTWEAITTNDGTEPTGDVVVRMYKNGIGEFNGITFDTFDMMVTGTGDLTLDGDSIKITIEGAGEASAQMFVTNLVIGEGITSIGEYSFDADGVSFLKTVKLPNSLQTIEADAFSGQEKLEKINIGNGVNYIGASAFSRCSSITELVLPETVTYMGTGAFANCTSLTKINIPNAITTLKGGEQSTGMFENCTSLKEITIPGGITKWYGAFENCTSLEKVIISEGVTIIDDCAFENCTSLKYVSMPESLIEIQASAFRECSGLENIIISDSVTSILIGAFYDCTSLKTVKLSSELISMGEHVFKNCTNLTDIYIPDKVTKIPRQAFYDCTSLTTIRLPAGLTNFDGEAISGCNSLSKINFAGTQEQYNAINSGNGISTTATIVYNYTGN